ncbi:hypothetical protein SEPL_226 [Salmonella phage SE_PL]|uniref:hypothetical protein n=1 Tax=Salmonella enterica TaxID=28901 RepID=UPI000FDF89BB|nr:hypothetical protein CPT_Munch_200 [Salmonella phage Munch]EAZ2022988.1 hypothetical protein [Salmonella enterica]ECV9084123.1 hypothetical protein [Salmonella enterica subsp. enterica serovar Infantis]MCP0435776.1 hypothetical protein [Salmonella enterica subsp. enterica serovar Mbandaka]QCW18886.1 hypothetical protein 7t3_0365 [Salmonella phage 7t3]QIG62839.1 hypothetical protein SEPL_226 [Salmonella phage SE_PL]WNV47308.1 hypothetical protein [Klebsiella phage fENko-Kae01]
MTDVIKEVAIKVATTVWEGVQDVFSSAAGALVAVVVAILLSIVPTFLLIGVAIVLFVGIVYSQVQEKLDKESE